MNRNDALAKIASKEYSFLKTKDFLGDNIVLLYVGGSHAYGTNTEESDLDIRGIATNDAFNIFACDLFSHYTDKDTDTTIYSFEKVVRLLGVCNPNMVEMLGLRPEDYLYINKSGKAILENKSLFLTKKTVGAFEGYAGSMLHRIVDRIGAEGNERMPKAMMHLFRLYYMACDILELDEVITYRSKEHKFLMELRDGKYITADGDPSESFYDHLNKLKKRFEYAKANTSLPDAPDIKAINTLIHDVNKDLCINGSNCFISEPTFTEWMGSING